MARRPRVSVLAAALLVLVGAAVGAPAAQGVGASPAVSTVPTSLVSIALTAPTTSLAGAQLTTLTVRMHLVDPDGVVASGATSADRYWSCPCVALTTFTSAGAFFRASPQAAGGRIVSLTLESGTAQDGVWRGTTIVGAADAGIWRPTMLAAGDFYDATEQAYPESLVPVPDEIRTTTAFNLRGYDWPVLSVALPTTVTPIGAPFLVRGSAFTSRTHRPLAGLRLLAGAEMCSPLEHVAGTATRTTTGGTWALVSTLPAPLWCVWFAPDRNGIPVNMASTTRTHVSATVTVRTSASSVAAGRSIAVTGIVRPFYDGLDSGTHVRLER